MLEDGLQLDKEVKQLRSQRMFWEWRGSDKLMSLKLVVDLWSGMFTVVLAHR